MGLRRVLGALVAACNVLSASCHGFLALPAARNVQHWSTWCPQCLNGPGICGDPAGEHDHEATGMYGSPPRIAGTYKSGGTLKARVVITANHKGRWGLEVCKLDPGRRERRACFKPLHRADGGGPYVYLPPSASESIATFRLPKALRCKRCVLRWHWETGNSCNPRGTPRRHATPGLLTCGARGAPAMETFTNCADVRIR